MATTPQTNATLGEIAQLLRESDDFVICGHVSPDGDCVGSQLALHHALRALGKRSQCVLADSSQVGASLAFLPGALDMVPAASYDGSCATFVGVDVPNRERLGAGAELLDRCGFSVTIDHHASETTMCDRVHVDPDAASCSMLVWEVVKHLLDEPPAESVLCAYTGLVTDTGGFRFQNADARAFGVASELVERGADPARVATEVFQSRTMPSLKLEALVLDRLRLLSGGAAAISWVSQADMERLGAARSDTEPLIDAVRSLAGVRVACVLREQDGIVKGSLRAKDDTDVAALAREFGGGGHRAAAGLSLRGTSLEDAVELVSSKLCELVA